MRARSARHRFAIARFDGPLLTSVFRARLARPLPTRTKDPNWTKSDTDHLVRLCHRLDLRWPVIADRYAQTPPRPVEQLQQRYYFVAHTLIVVRSGHAASDETIVGLGINASSKRFNLDYEEQRRSQLEVTRGGLRPATIGDPSVPRIARARCRRRARVFNLGLT